MNLSTIFDVIWKLVRPVRIDFACVSFTNTFASTSFIDWLVLTSINYVALWNAGYGLIWLCIHNLIMSCDQYFIIPWKNNCANHHLWRQSWTQEELNRQEHNFFLLDILKMSIAVIYHFLRRHFFLHWSECRENFKTWLALIFLAQLCLRRIVEPFDVYIWVVMLG